MLAAKGELDSVMDVTLGAFEAMQARNENMQAWFSDLPYSWLDPCARQLSINTQAEPWDDTDLMAERTSKHYSLEEWENTWMHQANDRVIFISALNKENLIVFRERVYNETRKIHVSRFPYNHFLYPEGLD